MVLGLCRKIYIDCLINIRIFWDFAGFDVHLGSFSLEALGTAKFRRNVRFASAIQVSIFSRPPGSCITCV